MTQRILCIGGGGHAAVVIDLLQAMAGTAGTDIEIAGFTDVTVNALPILDAPWLGTDADIPHLIGEKRLTHFIVAVGSIRGGGDLRARLFAKAEATGLAPFTAVHPSAVVATSVSLGGGSVVMAGAVIQTRVDVGRNVIVNTRVSIDHDCRIGDNVHVAPGAILSGSVTLDDGCHVGTGACILQNIRIGRGATVAAGATVTRDVAANAVVKGTPAR